MADRKSFKETIKNFVSYVSGGKEVFLAVIALGIVGLFFLILFSQEAQLEFYGYLKFLAYLDLGGSIGWNWFSLLCMGVMLYITIKKMRLLIPHGRALIEVEGRYDIKHIPLFLVVSICTLFAFYCFTDLFSILIANPIFMLYNGQNPYSYVSEFIWQHFSINIVPANFPFMLFYFGIALTFNRKIKIRGLLTMLIVGVIIDFISLSAFGTYTFRVLPELQRIVMYYALFIPSWMVQVYVYSTIYLGSD